MSIVTMAAVNPENGLAVPIITARPEDAGAAFVLESKGQWYHAGYHLTTAIVGPSILALPFAFRGMGWALGFISLFIMGAVTFYAYYLMSVVLDFCEKAGRRHIRFRELASDVLGSGWMFYFVVSIQTAINSAVSVGCILLAGSCLQIIYRLITPTGSMKLYQFIAMVTVVMMLLSQLPSFHSLRHINLGSLVLSLVYSFLITGALIYAGNSENAPPRDFSLANSTSSKLFNAFTSISIIAAIFGNGILPEIQATLAPPATGKMVKGLVLCYLVIFITFCSVAISGYLAFGNKSSPNILTSLLMGSIEGTPLAPKWLIGLAVALVILQLFAIVLVYSQVTYEIMEKKSADVKQGMFSRRNLIPRIILRSSYMILCGFIAALLPFFADISAVVGAVGFIPLDFILPMLLYNITYKPSRSSFKYHFNNVIMIVFTGVGLLGAFSSIRQLVLDAKTFKPFSE